MQISSITNINFNGKIAYDDSMSSKRRKYIREHLEGDVFQYSNNFEDKGRLGEYELNKLINSYTKKNILKNESSKINYEKLKAIPFIYNVEPISGTLSYRGSTGNLKPKTLLKLKEAGVDGIISFNEEFNFQKEAEEMGLKTLHFPVDINFWRNSAFDSKEDAIKMAKFIYAYNAENNKTQNLSLNEAIEKKLNFWEIDKRVFIDEFTNFICEMQKPNRYIGCGFGVDRTNEMLTLNHLFNPNAKNTRSYFLVDQDICVPKIINLYNNLTSDDKQKMGWDKEFDKTFMDRISQM